MTGSLITLNGQEYSVRFSNRSAFRMSQMGFETYDPNRATAYMCALTAAMIDTPKQLFSPEQIFEHVSEMKEGEAEELFGTISAEVERGKKQPQRKKAGRGSESGAVSRKKSS